MSYGHTPQNRSIHFIVAQTSYTLFYMNLSSLLSSKPSPEMVYALLALAIAELILKGFAMWRAAQLKQLIWFIAILIFNTAGILPVVYLIVSKNKFAEFSCKPA